MKYSISYELTRVSTLFNNLKWYDFSNITGKTMAMGIYSEKSYVHTICTRTFIALFAMAQAGNIPKVLQLVNV